MDENSEHNPQSLLDDLSKKQSTLLVEIEGKQELLNEAKTELGKAETELDSSQVHLKTLRDELHALQAKVDRQEELVAINEKLVQEKEKPVQKLKDSIESKLETYKSQQDDIESLTKDLDQTKIDAPTLFTGILEDETKLSGEGAERLSAESALATKTPWSLSASPRTSTPQPRSKPASSPLDDSPMFILDALSNMFKSSKESDAFKEPDAGLGELSQGQQQSLPQQPPALWLGEPSQEQEQPPPPQQPRAPPTNPVVNYPAVLYIANHQNWASYKSQAFPVLAQRVNCSNLHTISGNKAIQILQHWAQPGLQLYDAPWCPMLLRTRMDMSRLISQQFIKNTRKGSITIKAKFYFKMLCTENVTQLDRRYLALKAHHKDCIKEKGRKLGHKETDPRSEAQWTQIMEDHGVNVTEEEIQELQHEKYGGTIVS